MENDFRGERAEESVGDVVIVDDSEDDELTSPPGAVQASAS